MATTAPIQLPVAFHLRPIKASVLAIWSAFGAGSEINEGLSAQEVIAIAEELNYDLVALAENLVERAHPWERHLFSAEEVLRRAAEDDCTWMIAYYHVE